MARQYYFFSLMSKTLASNFDRCAKFKWHSRPALGTTRQPNDLKRGLLSVGLSGLPPAAYGGVAMPISSILSHSLLKARKTATVS
jgi:hypothetical protein